MSGPGGAIELPGMPVNEAFVAGDLESPFVAAVTSACTRRATPAGQPHIWDAVRNATNA